MCKKERKIIEKCVELLKISGKNTKMEVLNTLKYLLNDLLEGLDD